MLLSLESAERSLFLILTSAVRRATLVICRNFMSFARSINGTSNVFEVSKNKVILQ